MNEDRRQFLKIALIGSASFILGKIFGPVFSVLLDNTSAKADSEEKLKKKIASPAFRVHEDKHILSIYDESGEEIFQIDKDA